jgi:parallel beta-helix repeat protein
MKNIIFIKTVICVLIYAHVGINFVSIPICSTESDSFIMDAQGLSPFLYQNSTTLYVGGSGPGNYTRIQDAIDNASDGDTIFVYDYLSPYMENIIINKSIDLIGENRNTTIIDGNEHGSVVYIIADQTRISEFSILHSGSDVYDAGIFVTSGSNSIYGNVLISNKWYGIYVNHSSNNFIYGNSIVYSDHCGVCFNDFCDNNKIYNNIISEHYSFGILLSRSTNYTSIYDNTIIKNGIGIEVNGLFNTIYNNFFKNEIGIGLIHSYNSIIVNNTFIGDGITFQGMTTHTLLSNWNTHIIENNTLNGKLIRYYKNINNGEIPNDTAQIILANCNNFILKNFDLSFANIGIQLGFSSYNQILNGSLRNNGNAIQLYCSSNNNITQNFIYNNKNSGISLTDSSNNTISRNIITNSGSSIFLYGSLNNTNNSNNLVSSNTITHSIYGIIFLNGDHNFILGNTIENSTGSGVRIVLISNTTICNNNISDSKGSGLIRSGIEMGSSDNNHIFRNNIERNSIGIYINGKNNIIQENTIENNTYLGISMYFACLNNKIYHNNFINNHVETNGDNNLWDDGINFGNYWSWYKGADRNGDGIGDTPMYIPGTGDTQDRYPLIFFYEEKPSIKIWMPENGFLYVRNFKVSPFFTTLILGNMKIKVSAANYIYGIDHVEFYVDDILRKTDSAPPYNWMWRLSSPIKHKHTIKVIAFDNIGQNIIDDIVVLKFF